MKLSPMSNMQISALHSETRTSGPRKFIQPCAKSQELLEPGGISLGMHSACSHNRNDICSASRGNPVRQTCLTPAQGRATPATEIVLSDFTCSVSSLGQSSLHYPPGAINLRRSRLADTHSWRERIQILHVCMWIAGRVLGPSLRFASHTDDPDKFH